MEMTENRAIETLTKMQTALREAPKFLLNQDRCECHYEMGCLVWECFVCKWREEYDELLSDEFLEAHIKALMHFKACTLMRIPVSTPPEVYKHPCFMTPCGQCDYCCQPADD